MTKAILLSTILFSMFSSLSIKADSGEIILRNGHSGVRISIGDERMNDRDLRRRIVSLEKAVRDLQNEVYNLQDTRPSEQWICTMKDNFGKTYYSVDSESFSQMAAQRSVVQQCESVRNAMFCDNDIRCSRK